MHHVPSALQCLFRCIVERSEKGKIGRMGVKFLKEGKEWRLPGPLYADFLFLCSESKKGLKVMVERFVEVAEEI